MLTWLRKRSGDRWVKILMVMVALTFFGGFGILSSTRFQSCLGGDDQLNPRTILAEVGGEPITIMAFENRYSRELWNLENRNPGLSLTEEDRKQLRENTMTNMVRELLLAQEAKRLGIQISDAEVQQFIAAYFADVQGNFNLEQYELALRRSGFTTRQFEENQREILKRERVAAALTSAIEVLPEEVRERYAFYNQKLKFDYLVLDPAAVGAEVLPSDTAVRDYYAEHEYEFYYEEARRVEYVAWPLAEVMAGMTISEDEIRQQYEKDKLTDPKFLLSPEQVMVSQIFIGADRNYAPEEMIAEAKKRIDEIHAQLLEPEADFAKLASTYSEDGTRNVGGDWGWFIRKDDMNPEKFPDLRALPTEELEKAAFTLEAGQVSGPIQTDDGFRILKMTGKKTPKHLPLAVVQEEIEHERKKARAVMALSEKADAIKAETAAGKSFQKAAENAGFELQTSQWFQMRDQEIFGMEDGAAVVEEAFSEELGPGEVSEPVSGNDHLYLIRVAETKKEWAMPLSETRPRIVDKLKPEFQLEHTKDYVKEKLKALSRGELSLAAVAAETGSEILSTDFMPRNNSVLKTAGIETGLSRLAVRLSQENPWPEEPIAAGGKVIIIKLVAAESADMTNFEMEREQYREEILRAKRGEALSAWLDELGKKKVVYSESWEKMKAGTEKKPEPAEEEEQL